MWILDQVTSVQETPTPTQPHPPVTVLRVVNGIVAAGLTIGVGQLVAAVFDRAASPLFAVGSAVIDLTPKSVREFAISTFGTGDKTALLVGMGVIVALLAVLAGLLETSRRRWGSGLFVVFGALGVAAAVTRPAAGAWWFVPTVLGVAAGIAFLRFMAVRLDSPTTDESGTGPDRRAFLLGASGAGAAAVVTGVAGSALDHFFNDVSRDRSAFSVPRAVNTVDQSGGDDGATSFVTDNSDFYRIDTALQPPQLTSGGWSLRIHGMVDREVRIDMAALRRMPAIEKLVTLTCVSNEVGGDLIGNATWTGYRLRDLLAMAGPSDDADMVLSSSSDGFTAGTPLEAVTDDRDSLLAVAMNGKPLPIEHGYPARMVVPGLYGYV